MTIPIEAFLEYFVSEASEDTRHILTFLKLLALQMQIGVDERVGRVAVQLALQSKLPTDQAIIRALRFNCTVVMRRINECQPELFLAIAILCLKAGPQLGGLVELIKSGTVRSCLNWALNADLKYLFGKLYGGNLLELFRAIIQDHGWSDRSVITLCRFLEGQLETESVPVELADLVHNSTELSYYLDLIASQSDKVDALLCAHDLLVRFSYPLEETRKFMGMTESLIGSDCKWAVSNICSNCERFILSNKNPAAMQSILILLGGIAAFAGVELDRVLSTVRRTIESSPNLVTTGFVNNLVDCIDLGYDTHLQELISLWMVTCKIHGDDVNFLAQAVSFLGCVKKPWLLFNSSMLVTVDIRKEVYLTAGKAALYAFSYMLKRLLESNSDGLNKEAIDALLLHASALLKAPFTSVAAGPASFAGEHHKVILKVVANIYLYQVRRGWKTWRQIINEYSPIVPWIQYGTTRWHLSIVPSLYKRFIRANEGFEAEDREIILVTAILELVDWNLILPRPRQELLLDHYLRCFHGNSKYATDMDQMSFALKSYTLRSSAAWSLLPKHIFRSLDDFSESWQFENLSKDAEYFQMLVVIINLAVPLGSFESTMARLLGGASPGSSTVLTLLMDISAIQRVRESAILVDHFDRFLDHARLDCDWDHNRTFSVSTDQIEFLLMRLTSILFATNFVRPSLGTQSLLHGLIRAIPLAKLVTYLDRLNNALQAVDLSPGLIEILSCVIQFGLQLPGPSVVAYLPIERLFSIYDIKIPPLPSVTLPIDEGPERRNLYLTRVCIRWPEDLVMANVLATLHIHLGVVGQAIAFKLAENFFAKRVDHERHQSFDEALPRSTASLEELDLSMLLGGYTAGCCGNHPLYNIILN